MTSIKLLHTYQTEYSADSIEWCPIDSLANYFVCGTYQLEEASGTTENASSTNNKRKGRILLFDFDVETESCALKQQLEMDAVLDQKWHNQQPYLAVATSMGDVVIYQLKEGELMQVTKTKVGSSKDNLLALSLDWNMDGTKLVVSNSKGGISVVNFSSESVIVEQTWHAHGFEAWTCAFDKWNSNIVYTGGDDAVLNTFDLRCSPDAPQLKWKNSSAYFAGVTSLLSFKTKEFFLATGSYDERLQIFDIRTPKSTVSNISLGGGIWRLRPNPWNENTILSACMYHNFSIVKMNELHALDVVATFNEHASICYGCDWSHKKGQKDVHYFATCSFYDQKMCVCSTEEI